MTARTRDFAQNTFTEIMQPDINVKHENFEFLRQQHNVIFTQSKKKKHTKFN